jgi:hypothetical protein
MWCPPVLSTAAIRDRPCKPLEIDHFSTVRPPTVQSVFDIGETVVDLSSEKAERKGSGLFTLFILPIKFPSAE